MLKKNLTAWWPRRGRRIPRLDGWSVDSLFGPLLLATTVYPADCVQACMHVGMRMQACIDWLMDALAGARMDGRIGGWTVGHMVGWIAGLVDGNMGG